MFETIPCLAAYFRAAVPSHFSCAGHERFALKMDLQDSFSGSRDLSFSAEYTCPAGNVSVHFLLQIDHSFRLQTAMAQIPPTWAH